MLHKDKIMVVDDDALNNHVMEEVLGSVGYHVITVQDPSQVITMVRTHKPDVILLDIIMPDIDGFQLCEMLMNDKDINDVIIIMVTSMHEGSNMQHAFELGAFDYIRKPFDEMEVKARVQSALRYKRKADLLRSMAVHDSLTGTYNHGLLLELLDREQIQGMTMGGM